MHASFVLLALFGAAAGMTLEHADFGIGVNNLAPAWMSMAQGTGHRAASTGAWRDGHCCIGVDRVCGAVAACRSRLNASSFALVWNHARLR